MGKQIFNISETQAETVVQLHCVTNDLSWKAVSVVAGQVADHRSTLPVAPST
jgi:hypothetical protein